MPVASPPDKRATSLKEFLGSLEFLRLSGKVVRGIKRVVLLRISTGERTPIVTIAFDVVVTFLKAVEHSIEVDSKEKETIFREHLERFNASVGSSNTAVEFRDISDLSRRVEKPWIFGGYKTDYAREARTASENLEKLVAIGALGSLGAAIVDDSPAVSPDDGPTVVYASPSTLMRINGAQTRCLTVK